ncbi:MAG: bifunctional nuclease family protein [Bacteroidota bacterium]
MGKIKLTVLGISYSQTQSGAYALVLSEENGNRRIPIIIGGYEAQAIAIQLEGLTPPRPLTHDLFLNFARAFGIDLIDVHIYKLEDGVFFSKLHCEDGKKELFIDSRTSDAVALALRFNCPIYTTDEIIEKAGITLDVEDYNSPETREEEENENPEPADTFTQSLMRMSAEELKELLDEAIKNEEYEKATKIRDEIKRREKK